ncbi:hypothetical protein C8F01DRAFT_641477 [Mycena amicta]|nr:hypothetical protein C8F01DRAFT_641477 [Mycena amicta]
MLFLSDSSMLRLRPRWFRDTFDPQYARAQVEGALAGSIDDIIEDLSDRLTNAVYAEIIHANNPLEKVKMLFRHLDAQLGNEALVHAFEMAALKHGGVGYMFLSEQERGERARSKQARATAFGIVRDSRYGLHQWIVIFKLWRELTLESEKKDCTSAGNFAATGSLDAGKVTGRLVGLCAEEEGYSADIAV